MLSVFLLLSLVIAPLLKATGHLPPSCQQAWCEDPVIWPAQVILNYGSDRAALTGFA